jgi:hypothetical protein
MWRAAYVVTTILLFFEAKAKPLKLPVYCREARVNRTLPMWRQKGFLRRLLRNLQLGHVLLGLVKRFFTWPTLSFFAFCVTCGKVMVHVDNWLTAGDLILRWRSCLCFFVAVLFIFFGCFY